VQLVTAAAGGLEAIPLDLGRFDNRAASEECRSATGPGAVCAVGTSPRAQCLSIDLREGGDNLWFVRLQTLLPSNVFQRVVVDQHEHLLGVGDAVVGRRDR
jgi:hypothetical protein